MPLNTTATPSPTYPIVQLIENGEAVQGGLGGVSNRSAVALAERTEYLRMYGIAPWDASFNYAIGAVVQVSSVVYKAKTANINKPPASNPNDWAFCPMTDTELTTWLGTRSTTLAGYGITDGVTQVNLQKQTHTAFMTSGTAPAYLGVLPATTPAVTLTAGLRARAQFHASTANAATLNLNGLGAKNIKQYDATGAKVPAIIVTNQLADVEYDGTDWVILDPLPVSLMAVTSGTSTAYTASVNPAPTALYSGLRVMIIPHAASTGACTLALNGLAAKSIKQVDTTGAKVDPVLFLTHRTDLMFDGTDWLLLNPVAASKSEMDNRYLRIPQVKRAFTPANVLADMPSANTSYVIQTIQISGARTIRCTGHAAFANSNSQYSVGVTLQMQLNGVNVFGGHYLGGTVTPSINSNVTQIPISISDRKLDLDPTQTYTLTLIASKTSAVGPVIVLDAYMDVEYA